MQRRQFITLVGGVAAAWPLAARAQQKLPVVGWLSARSAQSSAAELAAFKRGLEETGYVEGRNLAIEYRWAEDHFDRLPALAADLVGRKVAVIVALGGTASALAAKPLTATIPIVFTNGGDPIATGLVTNLAHPEGNLTGNTVLMTELGRKRLELLYEVLAGTRTIAALINPTNVIGASQEKDLQEAARTLGVELHVLHAATDQEVETAFETVAQLRAGGLMIGTDPFFTDRSEQLATLALRRAVPTIYQFHDFAAAGGLMSYGASNTDAYRLAGVYVGRVLHGEKPADLPVQQPTKVELIINMKTAKTLGITVPLALLGRADEVIE